MLKRLWPATLLVCLATHAYASGPTYVVTKAPTITVVVNPNLKSQPPSMSYQRGSVDLMLTSTLSDPCYKSHRALVRRNGTEVHGVEKRDCDTPMPLTLSLESSDLRNFQGQCYTRVMRDKKSSTFTSTRLAKARVTFHHRLPDQSHKAVKRTTNIQYNVTVRCVLSTKGHIQGKTRTTRSKPPAKPRTTQGTKTRSQVPTTAPRKSRL